MIRLPLTAALLLTLVLPGTAGAQDRRVAAGLPKPAAAQALRSVRFEPAMAQAGGTLVLPLAAEAELAGRAAALDAATRGSIARALTAADFKYAARATLSLRGVGAWRRVLVVGLGEKPDEASIQAAGIAAGRALVQEKEAVTVLGGGLGADRSAALATGMGIGQYRPDLYNTGRPAPVTDAITIVGEGAGEARASYERRGKALVDAMLWARDIANEPANVVYPEIFVERARAAFSGVSGVTIEVLDPAAMERLGMGALLGVGRGSERESRMLIIRYRGPGAPSGAPLVLVGKGITFDSGGISIKPSANMGNMKFDMSGAASVTGAALALARGRAPVNIVAISALAENMPDGAAIRPGDILRAMNGRTIEIVSTDAEGRLVLADALSWADAQLKPAAIVDVATLTGAMRVALGDKYAGFFTRQDALATQIDAAARATGEAVWRMPLHASYGDDLKSTYADMKNGGGSGAGSGVGAYFIGEFVKPETPWAHFDIAGVAYADADSDSGPPGSTGWGIRLLERFARDFKPVAAEKK